jgi:hypothetical protein
LSLVEGYNAQKSLLKMKEAQAVNVCILTTTKVEDFDEAMLIVQVRVGSVE